MATTRIDQPGTFDYARAECGQRGPAWLWDLAGELDDCPSQRILERYGSSLDDVRHYRQLCGLGPPGRQQAEGLFPLIAAAECLNHDIEKTKLLKIAVLGEIDQDEIVRRLGVEKHLLQAWEQAFFAARGNRSSIDWIRGHVIQPELNAGNAEFAARLKMAAAVGPVGARVILDADSRVPIDEGQRLFDRMIKLSLKFDAAAELSISSQEERIHFSRLHVALQHQSQQLRLARERLEQKCREASDRHELAKIRLEMAQQREARRVDKQARRREERSVHRDGELHSEDLLAERKQAARQAQREAMEARAAESPLAQLHWAKATPLTEPQQLREETTTEAQAAGKTPIVVRPLGIWRPTEEGVAVPA